MHNWMENYYLFVQDAVAWSDAVLMIKNDVDWCFDVEKRDFQSQRVYWNLVWIDLHDR